MGMVHGTSGRSGFGADDGGAPSCPHGHLLVAEPPAIVAHCSQCHRAVPQVFSCRDGGEDCAGFQFCHRCWGAKAIGSPLPRAPDMEVFATTDTTTAATNNTTDATTDGTTAPGTAVRAPTTKYYVVGRAMDAASCDEAWTFHAWMVLAIEVKGLKLPCTAYHAPVALDIQHDRCVLDVLLYTGPGCLEQTDDRCVLILTAGLTPEEVTPSRRCLVESDPQAAAAALLALHAKRSPRGARGPYGAHSSPDDPVNEPDLVREM
jgi:hypothetical protein